MAATYLTCSVVIDGETNCYLHMLNRKVMGGKVYDGEADRKLWEKSTKVWKQVDERARIVI